MSTLLACDHDKTESTPKIHCFESAPYVVVYKYALSTEIAFEEVAKNNTPGIPNAVISVEKHKVKKPATTLIDKVANLINATGVIKCVRETTT